MINISAYPKENKTEKPDMFSEYTRAIDYLRISRNILIQEKERWIDIHTKPEKDKVYVENTEDGIKLDLEILPSIKNEVNNKSITRTYYIKETSRSVLHRLFIFDDYSFKLDFMLLSTINYPNGLLPAWTVGISPNFLKGFGASIYTNCYSVGSSIYYLSTKYYDIGFHLMLGIDWEGNLSPGIGIGYRF